MASSESGVQGAVQKGFSEYVRDTPQAVAVLACSFFSGQLWVFLVVAYLKKNTKANALIQSMPGKTALGLCWFTFVMVPIYYISYNNLNIEYGNLLGIVLPTLVAGFFLQVIVFVFFVTLGK